MEAKEALKLLVALTENGKTAREVPFAVGQSYFIRTVTYHLTGRVREIVGNFLVMDDAAWIADSGRFSQAIKTGSFKEVEPVETMIVNMDSITDASPWSLPLPRETK